MSTASWQIVAEREVAAQVRSKMFRISTVITCLAVLGGVIALGMLRDRAPSYDIGVTGGDASAVIQASRQLLDEDAKIDVTTFADQQSGEEAVRDGKVDVLLNKFADSWELVGDEDIPATLGGALSAGVQAATLQANAASQDVDLEKLSKGAVVSERVLAGDVGERTTLRGFGFVMGLLFYVFALIFGMQIAYSVVQEKESRVVEILAAAVETRSLMWGKVIANTVLAVGQVVLLALITVVGLLATGSRDLLAGVGPALGWFIAFFVIGFIALAALWSAAAALASRVADINSTTMPMQVLLFTGYALGSFGSGRVTDMASMVPVISSMVMPGRIALGGAPVWQIVLALALNAVAAVLFVRLGARIYDQNLLQTSRKVGFREAFTR